MLLHSRSKSPLPLLRASLAALTLILLSACGTRTNLNAVREFTKTSAATAHYEQVVADYVNSPVRQKRYQPKSSTDQLDALVARRAEQGPILQATQQVLVTYMSTLGDLAADQLPNVDSEIDSLSSALEKAKFIGDGDKQIGRETATAAASIAKVLIRASLDGYRRREVARIVKETNPALQSTIAGLKEILEQDMRDSLTNEGLAVKSPFRAWIAAAESKGDPDGAPPVARILMDERLAVVNAKEAVLDDYIKVLVTIAKGHEDLTNNIDAISKNDLKERLKAYSKDLQTLYKSFKKLNG